MNHYNLNHFIHDLEHYTETTQDYSAIIQGTVQSMQKLLSNPYLFDPTYVQALIRGEADGLLYRSPENRFVVLLFSWQPGAETPVHDHETWGVMGIYHNELLIREYGFTATGPSGERDLVEQQNYLAEEGMISYIIPPLDEIHQISNPSEEVSLSIHVYGKDIDTYNIFDLKEQQIHRVGG